MRVLGVMALTLSGCFGHGANCAGTAIASAAIESAIFIGQVIAEASEKKAAEEEAQVDDPPPSGIRDYWHGPERKCKYDRSLHLTCVRSVGGESCFWETSDRAVYDCPDDTCRTIPAELARWCY